MLMLRALSHPRTLAQVSDAVMKSMQTVAGSKVEMKRNNGSHTDDTLVGVGVNVLPLLKQKMPSVVLTSL